MSVLVALLSRLMRRPITGAWVDGAPTQWLIYHTGTATGSNFGAGNDTLTEDLAGWSVNEHQGKDCNILTGDGAGQKVEILSNTADTITIDGNWTHDPNGQDYRITDQGEFDTVQVSVISVPIPDVTNCMVSLQVEMTGRAYTGTAGSPRLRASLEFHKWAPMHFINDISNRIVATTQGGSYIPRLTWATIPDTKSIIIQPVTIFPDVDVTVGNQITLRLHTYAALNENAWELTSWRARFVYTPI